MLKISEMAKLADTTRRTLIFYDEKDVFKPARKTSTGYRYYTYDQLYDLMFIRGLRSLDIPLDKIKKIKNTNEATNELLVTQKQIDQKLSELIKIKKIINKRLEKNNCLKLENLYQPIIKEHNQLFFWCSPQSISCTAEEVAEMFSKFYKELDDLAVVNTGKSGFLTNLSLKDPNGYDEASFRIIKENDLAKRSAVMPMIERPSGKYVSICVENTLKGIHKGLNQLKIFCTQNNLKTNEYLWQINASDDLVENGASKYGWLEYSIIN
ncbi:MerR family transcriptional regulator [Pediococcus acidilactici]|uniref:MerR family transcriptional regulator n=1 Tax=Pediococcus acidilactici TaxID=1254 RepID=UPI00132061A5|nr:MerR family transcriptional regulator [Pediococcus acidilactici]KAF0371921.1 MerR family transcriptional regulator [Pediococcus acidilactici]KAF0390893.1 MerR family transcriptional regulator [Pediococcus acidilactici]